jgi:hypothetical protein
VSKYLLRARKPPSQTWRTFLDNHIQSLVSVDFFTVPTLRFQILYVFLVLAHDRRRILHFAVSAQPTSEWTAHQLREAFPWDSAPRYLLRDRCKSSNRRSRRSMHAVVNCRAPACCRSVVNFRKSVSGVQRGESGAHLAAKGRSRQDSDF